MKGLSRAPDGTWSGRAVKDGIEIAVSMDTAGNFAIQQDPSRQIACTKRESPPVQPAGSFRCPIPTGT